MCSINSDIVPSNSTSELYDPERWSEMRASTIFLISTLLVNLSSALFFGTPVILSFGSFLFLKMSIFFICRDQHVQETLIVAPVNVWITQMYFVILEVSFWINEIPCRPKRLSPSYLLGSQQSKSNLLKPSQV